MLSAFVRLRGEKTCLCDLHGKDRETGEVVIAFVRLFCKTANRWGVNTVRWGVRIFAVVQNISKTVKPIGGHFDAEYVRHRESRKSACIRRKAAF